MPEWIGTLFALLPFDWAHYEFMRTAFVGVLLLAPLFALPGTLVIGSGMSLFSDAIGHAALAGVAIGALLGLADPLPAMLVFAALLAGGLSLLRRYSAIQSDTAVGLAMAGSVALGVVLLSRGGNFNRFSRYLVGDLLALTPSDLAGIAILLAAVTGVFLLLFNRLFLTAFNRTLAESRDVPAFAVETFFSILIALVVTVAVQWTGILVVNSLFILPAAAARMVSRTLRQYVLLAVLISVFSCVTGLLLSFYWGTAPGATIALTALAVFGATLAVRRRV